MSAITDLIPTTLPTYIEKYRVGGYNRLDKLCYARIMKRTEVAGGGWPIEVNGAGDSPITLSTSYADKDIFSSISGSSCKISMVADSYNQLLELGRGDDTMWRVEVVEDGATIFRGFLLPETFQMEYGYEKPLVNIDATDGLGLLRNVPFAEGETFSGLYPVREVIAYILYNAGNRVNWQDRVNYAVRGTTTRNIYNSIDIPLYRYIGWDCYSVLEDVLGIINAQVTSIMGTYIIRLSDVPYVENGDIYTYRGAYVTSEKLSMKEYSLYDDYEGVSGRLRQDRQVKEITYSAGREAIENLVYNGDFELGRMGWSQWDQGGLTSTHWRINSQYKFMELDKKVLGEFEAYNPNDGVQFDFFRGATTRNVSLLVTFDVRVPLQQPNIALWVRINNLAAKVLLVSADAEWHSVSYRFALQSGATEALLRIARPLVAGQGIHMRNVKLQAGTTFGNNFNEVKDEANQDNIVINVDGVQSVQYETYRAFGGSTYMYDNAFPQVKEKTDIDLYDRASEIFINNNSLQRARASNFYQEPRARLSVELLMKDDSQRMTPECILFDKYLERNFVVMSFSYDLLRANYSLELMEYERASLPPLVWILADGTWNDNGYWVDTENWIDDPI